MNSSTSRPLRLTWSRFTLVALLLVLIFGGVTYLRGDAALRLPMGFGCLSILGYLAYRFHILRTQVSTGVLSDEELRRDFRGRLLGPLRPRVIWLVITVVVFIGLIALQG